MTGQPPTPTPESGERLGIISRSEVAAGMVGAAAGGAANVVVTIYVNPEGITGDQRDAILGQAQDRLDAFQQVARAARKSDSPDASATERFTGQKIHQTKEKIVAVSGRDTIDSAGDYVDALAAWPTLAGFVVGAGLAHVRRRIKHRRNG